MSNAKHGMPGRYQASPPDLADGAGTALLTDQKGRLVTTLTVAGSDIQLGAVELKNGTDDTRATIGATGLVVTLGSQIAGEDLTNDRMRVEQRFSGTNITSDTLVKTGAGFLHSLTFSPNDAAPTAGSIITYDNTAESGTILHSIGFTTTWFAPCTVTLDVTFSTGLYIGFTTTADVNVTPSYR